MAAGVDYCGPVKMIHKGFCLATLEMLIKYRLVGSYLVIMSTPRVPGGKPLLAIGYKYNYRMVLVFIATEGDGSTEPGDTYLSCFPYIYSNVYIHPVVCPHLLCRYLNACNSLYNHNRMWQSDIVLEKYWVTQSGYFRLATIVELGMGIIDGNLLYCHSVAEVNADKKISTLGYNSSTVYYCFNNPITYEFGSPDLDLPPITIYDRPQPHKRAQYNPDLPPAAIFVASENSVSTSTNPSDLTDILPTDDHNTLHVIKKYVLFER